MCELPLYSIKQSCFIIFHVFIGYFLQGVSFGEKTRQFFVILLVSHYPFEIFLSQLMRWSLLEGSIRGWFGRRGGQKNNFIESTSKSAQLMVRGQVVKPVVHKMWHPWRVCHETVTRFSEEFVETPRKISSFCGLFVLSSPPTKYKSKNTRTIDLERRFCGMGTCHINSMTRPNP